MYQQDDHIKEYPDSHVVSTHGCDECGSSDANKKYDDGHMFCYVCHKVTKKSNKGTEGEAMSDEQDDDDDDTEYEPLKAPKSLKVGPLPERGLTTGSLKKYGTRVKVKDGVVVQHYYPYADRKDNVVAWKVREVSNKTFNIIGDIRRGALFGQAKFPRGGKYVTICEGEIDTMSAYQMTGSKYTLVGIKNGAQAAYRDCKKAFDWLDSFENVIICFDTDDPGKDAAAKVASLFPKKAKIVRLAKKDVGKYLESNETQEFNSAWWRAEEYMPDDIISGAKMWDIINTSSPEARWYYPWEGLNKMTYGIRTGELVLLTAGSGMGKTTMLREIAYGVMKQSKDKLGLLFLEEQDKETGKGLMSVDAGIPFHLPDATFTPAQFKTAYDNTWGTKQFLTLNSKMMGNDLSYVCDRIKYMVIGQGCKFIILDHISMMVSDQAGDERKMLDEITHKLKAITVEHDVNIHAVVHTKRQAGKALEEGGQVSLSDLRGSGGLGQLSNMVYGLERDGQSDDLKLRNTTTVRVIKNRFCGRTGPATHLLYDENTGRLIETEISDERDKE